MHTTTRLFAPALAAYAFLAGCSGGSQSLTSIPNATTTQNGAAIRSDLVRSGIAPKYFSYIRALRPVRAQARPATAPADLYVDDASTNSVDILANKTWANVGMISGAPTGIEGPDGNFVDKIGRLYVANYNSSDITEYAPGTSTPLTLYNAGMIDPVDVTVDRHANVYEADWDAGQYAGFVNEYRQAINSALYSCKPGGGAQSVAVDSVGDVFVAVNYLNNGDIVEYKGGLKGCHATDLNIPLQAAGGMAFDVYGNLLVCDQLAGTVDTLAAPYTKITGTLAFGFLDPLNVKINRRNNQIYVADPVADAVVVLNYPSGTLVASLGSAQGLVEPMAAADGQNFLP